MIVVKLYVYVIFIFVVNYFWGFFYFDYNWCGLKFGLNND